MKTLSLILIFGLMTFTSLSQVLMASKPAKLTIYVTKSDGSQATMTSNQFNVLYNKLQMTGELDIHSFQTEDLLLQSLIDSAFTDNFTVSGMIPEGKFVFRDALKEQFNVEAELRAGDIIARIIILYEVSNSKTSSSNTFNVVATGNLSLKDDLGIDRETGLQDRISFHFFQNVQSKTY